MLNSKNERELCYVVLINGIEPIPGYDRVEHAIIGGWRVIVQKGQFNVGDPAIYFEIDSRVPSDRECFAFLEKRNYKVKTLKMCKTISQGLLMHAEDFGWHIASALNVEGYNTPYIIDNEGHNHNIENESRFLTKQLGVVYADEDDNQRKAAPVDKYKKMMSRRPEIFKKSWAKWMMQYKFGRKVIFFFFGKKKDKPTTFPTKFPYVKKSDEERVENMPYILQDKEPWVKTQKLDGTSSTYILERTRKNKFEQYVCSRNVRQLTPSQKNFHTDIEGNVYWMMAEKYKIFDFLKSYLLKNNLDYVCLQGETVGPSIQGNPHKFKELCFFGYNLIRSDIGRIGSLEAADVCGKSNIPWVPIVDEAYILPDDMETLKLDADGPCIIGEGLREGWVYRSLDGKKSFKNVSRQYLLKHNG